MSRNYIAIGDKLRMSRHDRHNIVLEQLTQGVRPVTREVVENWKPIGYYRTYRLALNAVITRDLLIDDSVIHSVEDYFNELNRTVDIIEKVRDSL